MTTENELMPAVAVPTDPEQHKPEFYWLRTNYMFRCYGIPCFVGDIICDMKICDGWSVTLWQTDRGWQTTMPGIIQRPTYYRSAWHAAYAVLRTLRRGRYRGCVEYFPWPLREAFRKMSPLQPLTERRYRINFLRQIAKAKRRSASPQE